MKVNIEEVSPLERKLSIEVPLENVTKAFDRVYKSIQRDANIKGFRKGKAPLATIKSLYKDRVKGDVVNELVQESYVQALDEKSLDPISYPNIQVSEISEDKAFSFTAQFEVRPSVKLSQYTGLTVEKEKLELDSGYVDKVLNNIRDSHSSFGPVLEDRPAKQGDFVILDFDGYSNGVPVENAKSENFRLELGSNSFIPGFEEGLIGVKPGDEKSIDLKFPDEYHAAQLAGKPVTFKVKVHKLEKKVLAELNDELFKKLGVESLEKLKSTIEEDYKKSEEKRVENDFKQRVKKALVAKNPVDVPRALHQEQKQAIAENAKRELMNQGFSEADFQDYIAKWDADLNETASYTVQLSFLIGEIADKENLKATEEDYDAKLQEYAKQTGIEIGRLKSIYAEKDAKSRLMFNITEDKVTAFLLDKAKIKEVSKEDLKDKN